MVSRVCYDTAMTTATEINTLYSAASAAMASGEWSTAITSLMQMQAALAATPNASRGGSGGKQSYEFDRAHVNDLINQCRRQLASTISSGPFQRTKVTYERAT